MMRRPLWLLPAGVVLTFGIPVTAGLYDSGELVAAGWELGTSHPPGQPLHAILARLAAFIPLGSIPFRMALPSLVGELAASWAAFLLTERILADHVERSPRLALLAPHAAALGLLLSGPLLRQATRVEVYGPALALTALSLVCLLDWARGKRGLYPAALAAGLVVALHPPHALVSLLFGAMVLFGIRRDAMKPRSLLLAAFFCCLGLSIYAYLPIRAGAGAPSWGDPTTLGGFVDYVSAQAYRQNIEGGAQSRLETLGDVLAYLGWSAGYLPVVGLALFALLARRSASSDPRLVPLLLLATLVASLAATLQPLETHTPDFVAYTAPALLLLFCVGCAGLALAGQIGRLRFEAGLLLIVSAANPLALREAHAHADGDLPALETLASALTLPPPPRAVVVTRSDFAGSTWMMARAVDGARPDVALIMEGLITSSWHWRSLSAHPGFDGNPIRGAGRTPREAYLNGALGVAASVSALATEADLAFGDPSRLDGVYLLHSPSSRPGYGERLMLVLDAEVDREVLGDHDVGGAVIRSHQLARLERLPRFGRGDEVPPALRRALFWLPGRQQDALLAIDSAPRSLRSGWVRDPTGFGVSREDLVRYASRVLAEGGAPEQAAYLLGAQLDRGEPRALLQLAWLSAAVGDRSGALEALAAFEAEAPELRAESLLLRGRLESMEEQAPR